MKSGWKLLVLLLAALLLGQTGDLEARPTDPSEAADPGIEASESFPLPGLPAPAIAERAGDPVIAAAGDIACPPSSTTEAAARGNTSVCGQEYTARLLGADLTAVLLLGDNQYNAGELEHYRAAYQPTWGVKMAITRPAPGNHEYETPGATGYFEYFGAAAGDPGKGYYSFDIGAWHLISLNGNCRPVGGCGESSPQETWLRGDLDAHRGQCTLAYWHQPRFSSGIHGNDSSYRPLWRALYRAHADIVLNGHDHDYERFAPQDPDGNADAQGIREFVVGTGGFSHYPFVGPPLPNTQVRDDHTFGVLRLTLHPTGYDWQFVPAAGNGGFTDSGSGTCHTAG